MLRTHAFGASSEWLITFSDKNSFYVDPGIVGTAQMGAVAPFEQTFADGTFVFGDSPERATTGRGTCCSFSVFPEPPITGGNYPLLRISIHYVQTSPAWSQGFRRWCSVRCWVSTTIRTPTAGSPCHSKTRLSSCAPSLEGNVFFGLPTIGFSGCQLHQRQRHARRALELQAAYIRTARQRVATNSTNPQSACQ